MIARVPAILAACALGVALLSGCAPVDHQAANGGSPTHDDSSASVPSDPGEGDGGDSGEGGATVAFPRITSCDQVAAATSALVQGMPLVGDSIADDGVLCQWSMPDDGPFASVTVQENTSVPTSDDLALQAKMLHLTPTPISDPRLAAMNAVAIRWTTDGSADAPGYSTVYVPGVSVELHAGRHNADGPQSYAPADDTTVDAALAVLAL